MLTSQPQQTVPAVPIGMKKAQENVAGSMGSNPGAPGPQVPPTPDDNQKTTLKKPKKKLSIKYILGGLVLLLLLIGAGAGFYLTQISQDVRQQASDDAYTCDPSSGTANSADIGDSCCGGGVIECKTGACSGDNGQKGVCTGGATIQPSPETQCANALESCDNTPCCGDQLVCQGQVGNRKCQDPGDSQQCPGGTCTGYVSFVCNSLSVGPDTSGEVACNENGQNHGADQSAAVSRANSTGCGQWDQVCEGGSNAGNLCGDFGIVNSSCGGTGGPSPDPTIIVQASPTPTINPSPSPSPSPTLAQCNEACSADTDCSEASHSCIGDVCRLTSNPESVTCEEAIAVGCGEPCQVSTDCAEANHACLESTDDGNPDGGVCRLISNPTSTTCVEATPEPSPTPTVGCNDACVTSSDCSDTDHSCNASTNSCRLTENPGDENCAPYVEPAPGCNEECYASTDCSNSSAVCYDNLCRLSTNPTNTSCQPKQIAQETGTYYEQPELPQALPESGSEDILNWLKVGLGALGLGLIFLFL